MINRQVLGQDPYATAINLKAMKRSRESFEKVLREFFDRHDPQKRSLSHRISHEFVNHQDEVIEHLNNLYTDTDLEITEDQIFAPVGSSNSGYTPY